jgi:hypothetical protein
MDKQVIIYQGNASDVDQDDLITNDFSKWTEIATCNDPIDALNCIVDMFNNEYLDDVNTYIAWDYKKGVE